MNSQLILGVSLRDQATFDNFWPGKNTQLLQTLKSSIRGMGERVIYLYGPGGLGRSHLLQACCHEAEALHQGSVYVPLADWRYLSPDIFEGLESRRVVCMDDIHRIAGQAVWEEAFFHVFNRIRDAGGTLVISAGAVPTALGLGLPDLVSRLAGGMIFQLQLLSDDEKLEMLMMRAERRGMVLSYDAGRFMLTHCPRHLSTLCAALDALDRASLAAQRRLTIPFIKSVLEIGILSRNDNEKCRTD